MNKTHFKILESIARPQGFAVIISLRERDAMSELLKTGLFEMEPSPNGNYWILSLAKKSND